MQCPQCFGKDSAYCPYCSLCRGTGSVSKGVVWDFDHPVPTLKDMACEATIVFILSAFFLPVAFVGPFLLRFRLEQLTDEWEAKRRAERPAD